MIKKDSMHINFRFIDGYNKPFVFVISAREAGKSTEWISKAYMNFKNGLTSLVIRRQVVDITEKYIDSIREVINKFYDDKIIFTYSKKSLKDGVVDVFINDKLFITIVALSCPIARLKSLVLPKIRYIFFDEFIVNPRFNEKYLKDEAGRFKEIYNTFYRESDVGITCYFLGNPYSHFNPYFVWLGVDTNKLHSGAVITGETYVIWCYKLTDELRQYILSRNPLYEFDDSYTRYGFDGEAICDENIRVSQVTPPNYSLRLVFKIESKYIGIYRNNDYSSNDKYYCKFIDVVSAYCLLF